MQAIGPHWQGRLQGENLHAGEVYTWTAVIGAVLAARAPLCATQVHPPPKAKVAF